MKYRLTENHTKGYKDSLQESSGYSFPYVTGKLSIKKLDSFLFFDTNNIVLLNQ